MAKYEHGVYEPPSDDIRVFDGGEEDFDEEGSRLPLLIVIALLVLAAFAGVVWLAYNQGLQHGREDTPRIIAAQQGPVRTAPQNPGGTTPYKGLKIYEQPAPQEEETGTAETAPPAKTATPAGKSVTTPAAPVLRTEKLPPAKPAPAKAAIATAAPATAAPVIPAQAKPVSPKPAYVVQIGAYKSVQEAYAAWIVFQRKHPIVGGYSTDIQKVDLGTKGIWYRLRIGSFENKPAADALCEKLKADGGMCFPAKF